MKSFDYKSRILTRDQMRDEVTRLHAAGMKVVFTNGAFDILHLGHLTYMTFAREQGDCLVVGLNSDASVRRYKGEKRPIVPQEERATMLAGLKCVDYVVIFDEDEPRDLIAHIMPDVLIKGEDWAHYVSGRDMVEARSTTNIVKKIVEAYGK